MKDNLIREIADAFTKSNYFIGAIGCRDVSGSEVFEIIKIIINSKPFNIFDKLKELHKYRPETIELDKSFREYNCNNFDKSVCDCFMPDIEFDNCYCNRERKKYLESTDYRNTPEYSNWRVAVFERDGFTCQNCGVIGGDLNAHHKKTYKKYPKLRFDINNGTTLCINCHREAHKKRTSPKRGG